MSSQIINSDPSMHLRFPVRRFIQSTEKTETAQTRIGSVQWVLSRPLYRFQVFDLEHVPTKNRVQALQLELSQWTPFVSSDYYVGWSGRKALVWCWDADRARQAIAAEGLKPKRVHIMPETVLQTPVDNGLSLSRCSEGFEGQFWRDSRLEHSRWWQKLPTQEEWLMFQRDAGIPSDEQQSQPPVPRAASLNSRPWLDTAGSASDQKLRIERLAIAICALLLLAPTLWYGFSLYKLQRSQTQLHKQLTKLQRDAEPILQARSKALERLARIDALRSLDPYPAQLELMAKIAEILPKNNAYLKDWDFQTGQLKVTIVSTADLSATYLIGVLQQAGLFHDVKALPGPDPRSVTFQMSVVGGEHA